MKSTELMVGDWVIDRREIEPLSRAVRPTRITSISYDAALQHAKQTLDGCNIDSIILQEYNLTNTISVQKPIKQ